MNKNFLESGLARGLTYFANLVLLNVLFILCSVPVLTLGAASSALYAMMRKLHEGETVVVAGFFSAFRDCLRQSTVSWLIMLLPGAFLCYEWSILLRYTGDVPLFVNISMVVVSLCYTCFLPWLFIQPVLFSCTQKQQFKNAALLILQVFPQTLCAAALSVLPLGVFLFATQSFFALWPLWLFLYFSASHGLIMTILKGPVDSLIRQFRPDDPA